MDLLAGVVLRVGLTLASGCTAGSAGQLVELADLFVEGA